MITQVARSSLMNMSGSGTIAEKPVRNDSILRGRVCWRAEQIAVLEVKAAPCNFFLVQTTRLRYCNGSGVGEST